MYLSSEEAEGGYVGGGEEVAVDAEADLHGVAGEAEEEGELVGDVARRGRPQDLQRAPHHVRVEDQRRVCQDAHAISGEERGKLHFRS